MHLKEKVDYAIKVVENGDLTDEENLEALETEIKILRELNHPHIVQLKEVVATADNTYIVMELCAAAKRRRRRAAAAVCRDTPPPPRAAAAAATRHRRPPTHPPPPSRARRLSGGELFNRIVEKGSYPEEEAAELFAQILLSVEYLHSKNIVHRDVKPENILYTAEGGRAIKLIDFGYAGMWAADSPLTGLCGTPDYVAPEVLTWYEDDDNGTPYGKGSDLWSLGVLLYVILSGCSPFSADEEEALLAQVSEAKYEFYDSEWKAISAPAKDLISKLLVVDPATRLTMEACLAHPWLAGAIEKGRQKAAEMASAGPSNGPTSAAAKSEVAVEGSPTAEPMSCSNCVLL